MVLVGQVMYYDHISKKAQRKETLRWERDMQRDGAVAESEPTEFQVSKKLLSGFYVTILVH